MVSRQQWETLIFDTGSITFPPRRVSENQIELKVMLWRSLTLEREVEYDIDLKRVSVYAIGEERVLLYQFDHQPTEDFGVLIDRLCSESYIEEVM